MVLLSIKELNKKILLYTLERLSQEKISYDEAEAETGLSPRQLYQRMWVRGLPCRSKQVIARQRLRDRVIADIGKGLTKKQIIDRHGITYRYLKQLSVDAGVTPERDMECFAVAREIHKKIGRLFCNGAMSSQQIADKLGLKPEYVSGVLKRYHGVDNLKKINRLIKTREMRRKIIEMHDAGYTYPEIRAEIKTSNPVITRALHDSGRYPKKDMSDFFKDIVVSNYDPRLTYRENAEAMGISRFTVGKYVNLCNLRNTE